MTDSPTERTITPDDFMQMERVEIVGGEIVEMSAAGALHVIIGLNIAESLSPYVKLHRLGIVFGDGMTFLMHSALPYLGDSYVPDVSFITADNIPAEWDLNEPHPGAPDFAVEIVSPNDRVDTLKIKLDTYLDKGTQDIWRVFPRLRKLEQHWREGGEDRSITYTEGRIRSRLLPEWTITVEDVFRLPEWIRRQSGRD